MQDIERQNKILNYLKANSSATVEFLAKTFYASPSTIRRDLTHLEKTGMIHRTHGGAVFNDGIKEISILVRKEENEEIKNRLAEIAASHIPPFNSVFIDNSSTCFPIIRKLNLDKKLVVTNSLLVVREVKISSSANTFLLGGDYDLNNMSTSGPNTADQLNGFNFDLMIQSASSVTPSGAFESESPIAMLKKIARCRAKNRVLIFDKSKLEKSSPFFSSSLEDFDFIVTDASDEEIEKLKNGNDKLTFYNL